MSRPSKGPHQGQRVAAAGRDLGDAAAAMVLVHGRGASAESILTLAEELDHPGFAFLAPQAAGGSWYPLSFLAPTAANEPGLSSALAVLADLVDEIADRGVPPERTFLLGFSQGACLTLEHAARRPRRYGGVVGLSGGVIGASTDDRHDAGSLAGTPVFLGCSDRDPHVPLARVQATTAIFRRLGAEVEERIYPGMPHTVNADEIEHVRRMMATVAAEDGRN